MGDEDDMELKLVNGDYVPDGNGGLAAASGAQEVLARVLFRLKARRGALPFLPAMGSRLSRLMRERPSDWQSLAERYVAEALEEETDLQITAVELTQGENGVDLTVRLDWLGEPLTAAVEL